MLVTVMAISLYLTFVVITKSVFFQSTDGYSNWLYNVLYNLSIGGKDRKQICCATAHAWQIDNFSLGGDTTNGYAVQHVSWWTATY